ncbi:MAG: hypothetical protein WDM92_00795 [Caulobacteraceae bacterium]
MIAYFARRLLHSALVLFATCAAVFALIYVAPGDPAGAVLGPRASPAARAAMRAEMGLDKPPPVQFAIFLGRLAHGDLGVDVLNQTPVRDLIAEALPPHPRPRRPGGRMGGGRRHAARMLLRPEPGGAGPTA